MKMKHSTIGSERCKQVYTYEQSNTHIFRQPVLQPQHVLDDTLAS